MLPPPSPNHIPQSHTVKIPSLSMDEEPAIPQRMKQRFKWFPGLHCRRALVSRIPLNNVHILAEV
jgi:hypothetical protein